jgi:predicted transcriptional regulator
MEASRAEIEVALKKLPLLTWLEWTALRLVNEKVKVTAATICHLMYKNQSALYRTEEILDGLWDKGLLWNMGEFHDYKYLTTELGDLYIEHAVKPAPPLKNGQFHAP